MRTYVIVPARYGSSRFPGKPIAQICGKPMMWWPYEAAKTCPEVEDVWVAGDDRRIQDVAADMGIGYFKVDGEYRCGTERVAAAVCDIIPYADVILNIQCDEVLIQPHHLSALIAAFKDKDVDIATLSHDLSTQRARSPAITKVVVNNVDNAMYFSRSIIPHAPPDGYCLGHIGVYGFRPGVLRAIAQMDPGLMEWAEDLEQLRWLENGLAIRVVHIPDEKQWVSINIAEDAALANMILQHRERQ